jgi:hypothetical protein
MVKDFKKWAHKLFLKWEKTYRKEADECDYEALEWLYWPKKVGRDKKKYRKVIRVALEGQIEFIKSHVALMVREPTTGRGNFSSIERFLSMQHLIDKYFPYEEKPPITITFRGGRPSCARVYLEELSDIDFADSIALLSSYIICISNRDYKTWSRKSINEVIQHIKEDIGFDAEEVEIKLAFDWYINKPGSHELLLLCGVKGLEIRKIQISWGNGF